jgi:hypothetical protein
MTLLALGSGWISDGQSGFGSFGGGRLRTHTDVGESERPPSRRQRHAFKGLTKARYGEPGACKLRGDRTDVNRLLQRRL